MAAPTGLATEQNAHEEQFISTFFCRALYDYQTADASSLSFHKNDIIEVLTQLASGWWDGLLGDERGWFPSNYVTVISDQEAETALNGSEFSVSQPSLADESTVDMAHSMSRSLTQSDQDGDWMNGDSEYSHHAPLQIDPPRRVNGNPTQHSDFWVPQVSQDGRIFYVNTQTGQHSRDLPQEAEEDSESDLAGLTTAQTSSRTGPNSGLGLASPVSGLGEERGATAGFGIAKRSHTPEPWVKRLADDGRSYYYVNKLDGQMSWTLPQSNPPPAYSDSPSSRGPSRGPSSSQSTLPSFNGSVNGRDTVASSSRLRSGSSVSQSRSRSDSVTDRYSINSDDSGVQPMPFGRTGSSTGVKRPVNGHSRPTTASGSQQLSQTDLDPSEQLARALQQALTPPAPISPAELSSQVRGAIASVMQYLQLTSSARRSQHFTEVDRRVLNVVSTVRNLLYVTATPTGHIPSHLYPRDGRDVRALPNGQTLQTHLKAAQRKVAGTLSKLVLSALAMQYDPGLSGADKPSRMESDVTELERAVVAFVMEVQLFQERNSSPQELSKAGLKRLYGVFSVDNIGMGLPGAGTGGNWKGLGYVLLDEAAQPPVQALSSERVADVKLAARALRERLLTVATLLRRQGLDRERLQTEGQLLLGALTSLVDVAGDIHIAHHVDIDGSRFESGPPSSRAEYAGTVETAQLLVRTLEAAMQSLYDDGVTFFTSLLEASCWELHSARDEAAHRDLIDASTAAITSNAEVLVNSLEALLAVGQDQASIGQSDYNESVEWRRSRLAAMEHAADAMLSSSLDVQEEPEEEFVDMADALSRPGMRTMGSSVDSSQTVPYYGVQPPEPSLDYSSRSRSESIGEPVTPTWTQPERPEVDTLVSRTPPPQASALDDEPTPFLDDIAPSAAKSPQRAAGAAKIMKILGDDAPQHYVDKLNADAKPWYLRPNYDQSEILMDPDGGVRAGTTECLVERLTAHEHGDTTFNQNFLMTFKSFMTVDELFDLLARRFWISPPPNLTQSEHEEWAKWKQNIIRVRVLNTFKTMVTDDGILEKEDMYILLRMKEFASNEEVISFAAAKQLLILIERAQKNGEQPIKTLNTVPLAPPAPILPRNSKKVKLLDIDPVELARQLTLMEAALYKKIRPMECLQRSREQKPGRSDNIASMIQLANRLANWVAESVLNKEDSRKRAVIVKHFISVADRCRGLQNYSTMTAIVSGLNTPPIRRLKRTWEQVNARFMAQLRSCEATIDSSKNFNNYRSTLARISPPCVPFIGVYLTTLTFINDGAEDKLGGNMINFRKRQKAAEVIQDIKRWQSKPYNFQTVGTVLSYLEESFNRYSDGVDYGDQFWALSLEREPREREDEKMARLLQESGFL